MRRTSILNKNMDYKKSSTNSKVKKETVELGMKQMLKNQIRTTSYASLFWSSIKFVGWRLWGIQFLLVGFSIFLLHSNFNMSFEHVIKGVTGLVLFSAIFFVDEVYKSFTNNTWELEQTFKYDLRQHTSMKLLVFGSFDFFVIIVLSVFAKDLMPVTFIQFSLFLLAPFNVFCILLFSVFTFIRNKISNILLWSISGVMVAGTMIAEALFNVYELPISYWKTVYLVTLIGLILLIRQMLKRGNIGGIFI